jgi:hypothetical protein
MSIIISILSIVPFLSLLTLSDLVCGNGSKSGFENRSVSLDWNVRKYCDCDGMSQIKTISTIVAGFSRIH